MIFILQFLSCHPLHSSTNTSYHLLFTSFKLCNTFLPMLILHGQHQSSPIQMRLTLKQQCLKRNFNRLGDLPTRIIHPGNLLQRKNKTSSNVLIFDVILAIKCPKLNTRNTGFIIATTGRVHALTELCEVWILHTFCSFGSGWDVFVMLGVWSVCME